MPTNIVAAQGDTLCHLAIAAGFTNCDKLRAEAGNAPFLNRPLQPGDIVIIPDFVKSKFAKAAEKLHKFVRKAVPVPELRFVHGSADKPYRQDITTTFLNVSNYVPNKAGRAGDKAFPRGFGYKLDGHEDPDAFKIEVVDPASGGTVLVELEALKPVYLPDGTIEKHEPFTDPQAASRKIKVECKKVSGACHRSRYLRLVTDEADLKELSGDPVRQDGSAQGLFTSDMSDGLGGDADKVEILDQLVRATHKLACCKAAAADKCRLTATAPIGEDRRRIRVALHIFRTAPGAASPNVGGVTEQMLRRRLGKWHRRAYAQASCAPRLVAPGIEFIDPPPANMLVLSNGHGLPATGASTITFNLQPLAAPANPPAANPPAVPVSIPLTAGLTPLQAAQAVAAGLPAGFTGAAFVNAPSRTAINGSADLIITKDDGARLLIRGVATTDATLTVLVPGVTLDNVDNSSPNNINPEIRRLVRAAPGADDRLDGYIIGQFAGGGGLRGLALTADSDLAATFQNPAPLRWAQLMAMTSSSGPVMDGGDTMPFTFPHESGHVLTDAFHATTRSEMMASGTSPANAIDATKRICDHFLALEYAMFKSPAADESQTEKKNISAVQRIRDKGASVLEGW